MEAINAELSEFNEDTLFNEFKLNSLGHNRRDPALRHSITHTLSQSSTWIHYRLPNPDSDQEKVDPLSFKHYIDSYID
jgi:hypothetical protein